MAKDTNYLRARIASELNRSLADLFGNSGETFATAVNRAINQAIAHYESQPFRWNKVRRLEFATTTAYAPNTSLPADFISMNRLEMIYSGRYYEICRGTTEEVNDINSQPSLTSISSSIPYKYTIDQNVLVLGPPTNAARTLVASYIKRFLPTSITDSTTAIVVMGGNYSLTVTTTTSHKNRLNGWTTDGADLIVARAKADLKINYLANPDAIQEMAVIASKGEDFLSVAEKQAYTALADETFDSQSTGKVRKYGL